MFDKLLVNVSIEKKWCNETTYCHLHGMENVRIRSYSGPDFPAFGLITERYSDIHSKCEKIRTKITPKADTFYALLTQELKPFPDTPHSEKES